MLSDNTISNELSDNNLTCDTSKRFIKKEICRSQRFKSSKNKKNSNLGRKSPNTKYKSDVRAREKFNNNSTTNLGLITGKLKLNQIYFDLADSKYLKPCKVIIEKIDLSKLEPKRQQKYLSDTANVNFEKKSHHSMKRRMNTRSTGKLFENLEKIEIIQNLNESDYFENSRKKMKMNPCFVKKNLKRLNEKLHKGKESKRRKISDYEADNIVALKNNIQNDVKDTNKKKINAKVINQKHKKYYKSNKTKILNKKRRSYDSEKRAKSYQQNKAKISLKYQEELKHKLKLKYQQELKPKLKLKYQQKLKPLLKKKYKQVLKPKLKLKYRQVLKPKLQSRYQQLKFILAKKYKFNRSKYSKRYQLMKNIIAQKYQKKKVQIAAKISYTVKQYLKDIEDIAHEHCRICRKWKFINQLKLSKKNNFNLKNLEQKKEILRELEDPYYSCYTCDSYIKNGKTPPQAFWNILSPGDIPKELEVLTKVECQMICRLKAFIRITIYQGKFGHPRCSGRTTVFPMDVTEIQDQVLANTLPRPADETGDIFIAESLENSEHYRQFKVNENNLRAALEWLMKNNPLYGDIAKYTNLDEKSLKPIFHIVTQNKENETKETKRTLKSAWKQITKNKETFKIIVGRFHQGSCDPFTNLMKNQPKLRQSHGLGICLTSILFGITQKEFSKWRSTDLDNILVLGSDFYVKNSSIHVKNLFKKKEEKMNFNFSLFKQKIETQIILIIKNAPVENLKDYLINLLENYSSGIIFCENVYIAVSKTTSGYFFMHDCNARSPKGNLVRKKENGQQVGLLFETLSLLFYFVGQNLGLRKHNNGKKFSIYAVELINQQSDEENEADILVDPQETIVDFNFIKKCELFLQSLRCCLNSMKECSDQRLTEEVKKKIHFLYEPKFIEIEKRFRLQKVISVQTSEDKVNLNEAFKTGLFSTIDVAGDGNCFYNAISMALCGHEFYSIFVRCLALKGLIEEQLDHEKGKSFSYYCKAGLLEDPIKECQLNSLKELILNIITDKSWATNGAIWATCLHLQRKLIIQNQDNRLWAYTSRKVDVNSTPIAIAHINYNHYKCILPISKNKNIHPNALFNLKISEILKKIGQTIEQTNMENLIDKKIAKNFEEYEKNLHALEQKNTQDFYKRINMKIEKGLQHSINNDKVYMNLALDPEFKPESLLPQFSEFLNSIRIKLEKRHFHNDNHLILYLKDSSSMLYKDEFINFQTLCQKKNIWKDYTLSTINQNLQLHPLLRESFRVVNVRGDGNCLFNAVSRSLFGSEKYSNGIRCLILKAIIEEEMNANGKLFSYCCREEIARLEDQRGNLVMKSLKQFIETTVTNGYWATNGSIYALCLLLKRTIIIQQSHQTVYQHYCNEVDATIQPIFLSLQSSHYQSLIPIINEVELDKKIKEILTSKSVIRDLAESDRENYEDPNEKIERETKEKLAQADKFVNKNIQKIKVEQLDGNQDDFSMSEESSEKFNNIVIELGDETPIKPFKIKQKIDLTKEFDPYYLSDDEVYENIITIPSSQEIEEVQKELQELHQKDMITTLLLNKIEIPQEELKIENYVLDLKLSEDELKGKTFKSVFLNKVAILQGNALPRYNFNCFENYDERLFALVSCIIFDSMEMPIDRWLYDTIDLIGTLSNKLLINKDCSLDNFYRLEKGELEKVNLTINNYNEKFAEKGINCVLSQLGVALREYFSFHSKGIVAIEDQMAYAILITENYEYYIIDASFCNQFGFSHKMLPISSDICVLKLSSFDLFLKFLLMKIYFVFDPSAPETDVVPKFEVVCNSKIACLNFSISSIQVNGEELDPREFVNFEEEIHCTVTGVIPRNVEQFTADEVLEYSSQIEQNFKERDFNDHTNIKDLRRKKSKPVNLSHQEHAEEYIFPYLFPYGRNGYRTKREVHATWLQYCQSRLFGIDQRFNNHSFAFYALNEFFSNRNKQGVSVCGNIKQGNEKNKNLVASIHLVMKNERGTSTYFYNQYLDLCERIKFCGLPSVFLTLSCNEKEWDSMLKEMLQREGCFSDENLKNITLEERSILVEKYPDIVASHFNRRTLAIIKLLKSEGFSGYKVRDYWFRVEFQMRGSPHLHAILWLEGIPDPESPEYIDFINKISTCSIPVDNPSLAEKVKKYQLHQHRPTCYKKRYNKKVREPTGGENQNDENNTEEEQQQKICRFGFPRKLSDRTKILDEGSIECIQNGNRTIVLQRKEGEENVNNYNPYMLDTLWFANQDVQAVTGHGITEYVTKHASKCEPEAYTEAVTKALDELNTNPNAKFEHVLFGLLQQMTSKREIGAVEARYLLGGYRLIHSSRGVEFINTTVPEKRFALLNIQEKGNKGENVVYDNIIVKFTKRPDNLEHLSLYEFRSLYKQYYHNKKNENIVGMDEELDDDDEENECENDLPNKKLPIITLKDKKTKFKQRKRPAVIRAKQFSRRKDPENFYYDQLLLHVPFRDENELLEGFETAAEAFEAKKHLLRPLNSEYSLPQKSKLSEEIADLIAQLKLLGTPIPRSEEELERERQELADVEKEINENQVEHEKKLLPFNERKKELENLVKNLNSDQKKLYDLVVEHCRADIKGLNPEPIRFIMCGSAGTGKSYVINAIQRAIEFLYYDSKNPNSVRVKKMAPTGVAACLIGGQTYHSALRLKIDQDKNTPQQDLTGIVYEALKREWAGVKLVVIDEFSMISAENLEIIERRLSQLSHLSHKDKLFGSMNIVLCGDPMQIPPMGGIPIYRKPADAPFLFSFFDYVELSINMRQKGDDWYRGMLERLRFGELTPDDITKLIEKKVEEKDLVGIFADEKTMRIVSTNDQVYNHNAKVLQNFSRKTNSTVYKLVAIDDIAENKTNQNHPIETITPKKIRDCGGLSKQIELCVGARVVLLKNISIPKGLVNGAMGYITGFHWKYFKLTQTENGELPEYVTVKFDRIEQEQMIHIETVKFKSTKSGIQIERSTIPLGLAWAATTHKLQGATVDSAVIDLGEEVFAKGQVYVMLSRIKSFDLFVFCNLDIGKLNKSTFQNISNDEAIHLVKQLRKLTRKRKESCRNQIRLI